MVYFISFFLFVKLFQCINYDIKRKTFKKKKMKEFTLVTDCEGSWCMSCFLDAMI